MINFNCEEESKDPNYLFCMDGSPHYIEEVTGCCKGFGKICNCGGFMHYQLVYGGYYYKCEVCKEVG